MKISSKFTGEHPRRSVILIKLENNFIEITLRHGCSINLLHIFRTPFLKNTSGWLLLLMLVAIKNKEPFLWQDFEKMFAIHQRKPNMTNYVFEVWNCHYEMNIPKEKIILNILAHAILRFIGLLEIEGFVIPEANEYKYFLNISDNIFTFLFSVHRIVRLHVTSWLVGDTIMFSWEMPSKNNFLHILLW